MFIGHYAVAVAATATLPEPISRRGTLTYLSFASALPDLLMLSIGTGPAAWNYHADRALFICGALVVTLGMLFRFRAPVVGVGIACPGSHLLLDIPYSGTGSENLYARPFLDFAAEGTLLFLATFSFVRKARPKEIRRRAFIGVARLLLCLQAAWNFGFGR